MAAVASVAPMIVRMVLLMFVSQWATKSVSCPLLLRLLSSRGESRLRLRLRKDRCERLLPLFNKDGSGVDGRPVRPQQRWRC
jgi:hypothetical protein